MSSSQPEEIHCLMIRSGKYNWLVPSSTVREIARYPLDAESSNADRGQIVILKSNPTYIGLTQELSHLDSEQKKKIKLVIFKSASSLRIAIPCVDNPELLEIRASDLDIITRPAHAHPLALNYTAVNHVPAMILDIEKLEHEAQAAQAKQN